jgi:hypothetical protein
VHALTLGSSPGSGVHANFFTHVSAKAASTSPTCQCEECGVRFISRLDLTTQTSCIRHKLGDMIIMIMMYKTIYVYDFPDLFPSRSSKLSSRSLSLRAGKKVLLHTTQFQTALFTASGERWPPVQ